MRSLATWRWRPCGAYGCGLAYWLPRRPAIGVRRFWRPAFAALICASAWAGPISSPAMAQRSAVTVDLGVLDTLGPADPAANSGSRIRLHMPDRNAQRPTTPPTGTSVAVRPAPAQAAPAQVAPVEATPAQATAQRPSAVIPAPATPPPEPRTQTAVAPPAASTAPAVTSPAERILFQPDDANLADAAKQGLDRLASRLSADGRLYVQLIAYAGGGGDASQARRLSLSRALAARSYLVDHGVEIRQIDVRPLGNKFEPGGAPDRIDLVVAQR